MVKPPRKKSYHGYEARLETFSGSRLKGSKPRSRKVTWPHARPSATQVAKAGFYFTPSPSEFGADLVTCYMCGSGIDGWEPEDDPLKVHAENCSHCPLAILQCKLWENDINHDPRGDEALSIRLQTYYQPLTQEELEEAIINSGQGQGPEGTPAKGQASSLMLMGTSVWPHDSKKNWKPTSESMAKAGFYYFPNFLGEDFGLCPYCNLGLDGWEPTDEPVEEHQRRSPKCLYFTKHSNVQLPVFFEAEEEASSYTMLLDDEGYDSSESIISTTTSNKRKKKSTTAAASRKKPSKVKRSSRSNSVNSMPSDFSESEASTSTVASTKKKRGGSKKTTTSKPSTLAKETISELLPTKQSPVQQEHELNTQSLSATHTTSPLIVRAQVPFLKESVSARISKFEEFSVGLDNQEYSGPSTKLAKSSSRSKVKVEKEPIVPEVSQSQSTYESGQRIAPKSVDPVNNAKNQLSEASLKTSIKNEVVSPLRIKEEPADSPSYRLVSPSFFLTTKQGPKLEGENQKSNITKETTKVEKEQPILDKNSEDENHDLEKQNTQKEKSTHKSASSKDSDLLKTKLGSIIDQGEQKVASAAPKTSWPLDFQNPRSESSPEIFEDSAGNSSLEMPKAVQGMTENWAAFSETSSPGNRSPSPPAQQNRMPRNIKAQVNLAQMSQPQQQSFHSPRLALQTSLAMLPKMPLNDTSALDRNTPPPSAPVNYGDDEARPVLKHPYASLTPARQTSPQQPSSPPSPLHPQNTQKPGFTGSWTAIDTDMVFDILSKPGSGITNVFGGDYAGNPKLQTGVEDDEVLVEKHLDKTVREWIEHLAAESEKRLKANCDALIEMLEKESMRAVSTLEALPVRA